MRASVESRPGTKISRDLLQHANGQGLLTLITLKCNFLLGGTPVPSLGSRGQSSNLDNVKFHLKKN